MRDIVMGSCLGYFESGGVRLVILFDLNVIHGPRLSMYNMPHLNTKNISGEGRARVVDRTAGYEHNDQ